MSSPIKQGLLKRRGLDAAELTEIKQLAALCNNHEGLDLKLNWGILRQRPSDQLNDFLYYVDGQLVGFLALFSFAAREGEISGMVHPAHRKGGIFQILFEAARQESISRGLNSLLLIVEGASPAGQAFVRHLPTTYDHSEYKMVLDGPQLPQEMHKHLHFRAAHPQDIPVLSYISAQAFQVPQDEINWYTEQKLSEANRRYYVGEVNSVIVGIIEVSFSEGSALIQGFAVLPEYQGKGYGRQMLARTVRELLRANPQSIWLEVMTENKQALALYQSCGFKEIGCYDYYRLPLKH
ncbi:GNAT family N-acetyltransferase [Ktedonosporobacter rubrisoli]|uniref:GNAT family N-acetyltransferase n=1 Tax=Ktedonosporobacter rubrisoli TaxID=2509675 RepID=A0A4P6JL32_KTERU|nr:GNAT family N-acetyltransferase [Ktedonosporobacter rubrisoli]QBD75783.1 GNAT family N-acetyltransferase [Ktedonosporobacter rubrisoli]